MNGVFKELMGSSTTNTTSWYGDYAIFVRARHPWFILGGDYDDGYLTGVFSSMRYDDHRNITFRVVLLTNP